MEEIITSLEEDVKGKCSSTFLWFNMKAAFIQRSVLFEKLKKSFKFEGIEIIKIILLFISVILFLFILLL